MSNPELCCASATALAALLRQRQILPVAVLSALLPQSWFPAGTVAERRSEVVLAAS
jgi:hypothetical protein